MYFLGFTGKWVYNWGGVYRVGGEAYKQEITV